MLLGVAGRRPKYWWDLGQGIDSDLGGLLGTHVRNSNGLYTNPNTGLITTVGNNIPRFERQDGLLALLDEPEGTNLIHYSHELGNVASGGWWGNTNLTDVSADGMLAPDGNVVADGLIADVNNSEHRIYNTTLIAGIGTDEKVVLTVFAKPGDKDWVRLFFDFYDVGGAFLGDSGAYYFDISTGTIGVKTEVGDTTVHNYLIEEAANGFYRIGIIVSNADGATSKIRIGLKSALANNDDTFPGNTTDVNTWFWGADLKKQAYFDSYVPTSGGTATRATESGYPLWDLPLGLFDAEGTCSVWVRFGHVRDAADIANRGVVSCRDSGLSFVGFSQLADQAFSFDGTTTAWGPPATLPYETWYKLVVKWSSTTLKMRTGIDSGAGIVWGGEVAFDGSYILGANLRLAYGLFGPLWLRDLRLYDRIPSDSEINSMGSP